MRQQADADADRLGAERGHEAVAQRLHRLGRELRRACSLELAFKVDVFGFQLIQQRVWLGN